jgi:16S rRNA (uracil1498-N3)-methyltransferase
MRIAKALAAPFWTEAHARFVLDDRSKVAVDPLASAASGSGGPGEGGIDVALAIGPEGGWSDADREALAAAGAQTLVLGSRVLRAETAVFAGLSVLQHRLGDLHA